MKNWRIWFLFFVFLFSAGGIIYKLIYFQILESGFYKAQALGQKIHFKEIVGKRGRIYFSEMEPLALNRPSYSLYLDTLKIKKENCQKIEKISGKSFFCRFKKGKRWILLKKDLSKKEIEEFQKMKLEGVYLIKEFKRYYPQKELASVVVGFLGGEGKGQYGLEGIYDEILKGERGIIEEKGGGDFLLERKILKPPSDGKDLILTLNFPLQVFTSQLLNEKIKETEAKGGEIVVIDPNSGKILALAIYPRYDPNEYFKIKNYQIFINSFVQSLFEPGSIFKLITFAIALNEKKITPQMSYLDKGYVKIQNKAIKNYRKRIWGKRTMSEVLIHSINTGAVFVIGKIKKETFWNYFQKFGFTEKTGIDLQGEVFSENKVLKEGRELELATASFGQGIEVTSVQLIKAFSAIANGGYLIRPYLVEKIRKGDKIKEIKPKLSKRPIISKEAREALVEMMIKVVEEGTGKLAQIPGYLIAGKTGTAQIPYIKLGIKKAGYSQETVQSFVGFFPAYKPKFLIFVKLNQPKTREAALSTAPLFKEVAKFLIHYYSLPPDYVF